MKIFAIILFFVTSFNIFLYAHEPQGVAIDLFQNSDTEITFESEEAKIAYEESLKLKNMDQKATYLLHFLMTAPSLSVEDKDILQKKAAQYLLASVQRRYRTQKSKDFNLYIEYVQNEYAPLLGKHYQALIYPQLETYQVNFSENQTINPQQLIFTQIQKKLLAHPPQLLTDSELTYFESEQLSKYPQNKQQYVRQFLIANYILIGRDDKAELLDKELYETVESEVNTDCSKCKGDGALNCPKCNATPAPVQNRYYGAPPPLPAGCKNCVSGKIICPDCVDGKVRPEPKLREIFNAGLKALKKS